MGHAHPLLHRYLPAADERRLHRHRACPSKGWPVWAGSARCRPALSRMGRQGAEVTSVPSVALPLYPEIRLASPRVADLTDLIGRFGPDLVHCQTEFGIGRAGKAAARRGRHPTGLLVSHRLRPVHRGLRRRLAQADREPLHRRVPPHQPAGVHPVDRGAGGPAAAGTDRRGGVGTRRGHRALPSRTARRRDAGGPRDGQPIHLPVRGAPRVGKARRPGARRLPPGQRDDAAGRDPSRHRGHRSARGGAAGARRRRA